MSTELTVLNNQTELTPAQQGGLGLDFSSPLFALKPGTININQSNTNVEGAIKGHFRISETGDQYEYMDVVLLDMPVEQRSFYIGEPGTMNRTPDNLMCFSRDMIVPDDKAKQPQAVKCAGCPKASWDKYRQTKAKADIPQCDAYYYARLIDKKFKMPLQMYIRSKSKDTFREGMQNLARKLAQMKSQGHNPNIFDISFRLRTKKITTGSFVSYVVIIDPTSFKAITPEERIEFGEIFNEFAKRRLQAADAVEEYVDGQVAAANESIDAQVTGSVDGEIVI